jgi:CheY-like chemotaxis protein
MGKPIIVMDDDPSMMRLFQRYMRNRRVEGASNPKEAMQLTATLGPGLIVVTNSTRAENVLAWQGAYPSLTDAELSILAYPIPSEHRKALALGLSDYLVKPISREQLCDGIARLGRPIHTILAIEDDSDMMRLLERMLSAAGHDVELHKAYSAEEAQVFLASQVPDLVLLDLALPGMSGYDFLSWMQKDASLLDVPVIVITANVHLEAAESDNTKTMTLIRRSGFSPQELLAFAEMVAEKLPSRYTMTTENSRAPTS